jgi:hypothetical protein
MKAAGQISVEYLIIIAVAIGILIPGIFLFYSYSQSGLGSTTSARVNEIGLRTISMTKSTYALGSGAWQTMEFAMPEEVTRVYVQGAELTFIYDTHLGASEAVFFSPITITTPLIDGNISHPHNGITKYRFVSTGSGVFINETT